MGGERSGLLCVPLSIFLTSLSASINSHPRVQEESDEGKEDESSSQAFYWLHHPYECAGLGSVSLVPPVC